jgi:hypothetical protein
MYFFFVLLFLIFYGLHIFSVPFSESPESVLQLNVRYIVVRIHTHIHTKLVKVDLCTF